MSEKQDKYIPDGEKCLAEAEQTLERTVFNPYPYSRILHETMFLQR